jgi:hypothetical protein
VHASSQNSISKTIDDSCNGAEKPSKARGGARGSKNSQSKNSSVLGKRDKRSKGASAAEAAEEDLNSMSNDDSMCDDDSQQEDGEGFYGKRGRKENGLVELTKKFISLLKEAPQ